MNEQKIIQKAPYLTVENLTMLFKHRGIFFKALNDVSFAVHQGDFFGIIGESGSGKSTVGKCLIKLLQSTGGKIEIENHLISNRWLTQKAKKWLRKNVSMIFQDPLSSLNPTKNILQLIAEPLIISKSLYSRTFKWWYKINNISRYFFHDFKSENYQIIYQFQIDYLTELNQMLQKLRDDISNDFHLHNEKYNIAKKALVANKGDFNKLDPLMQNDLTNYSSVEQRLIYHLDTLADNLNELSPKIFQLSDNYDVMLKKYEKKYDNNEYSLIFAEFEKDLKEYKHSKDVLDYSAVGLELKKDAYIKEKAYLNFIGDFSELYHGQNHKYLITWKKNTKQKVNGIVTDLKFTKDEIKYTINYFALIVQKTIYQIAKITTLLKELEEDEINALMAFVIQKVESFYAPLNEEVLNLSKGFANQNLADKKKTLLDLKTFRKVAYHFYDHFKKQYVKHILKAKHFGINLSLNKSLVKNDFDALFVENIHFTFFQKDQFEKYFEYVSKTYNEIYHYLANIWRVNQQRKNLHDKQAKKYHNLYIDAEIKYHNHLKKYKNKNSQELIENRKNFQKWKTVYHAAKQKRDQELDKLLHSYEEKELQVWLNQTKSKIDGYEKEHKALIQAIYKLFDQFLTLIANKYFHLKKHRTFKKLFLFKLFHKNGYLDILKKEILIRKKTVKSFQIEYKRILKNAAVYTFIFFKSRFINWITMPLLYYELKRDMVYKALNAVGLKREHAYRYPHEFSGGQRQRIVIARALINNPKMIIADEPISALDVSIQAQIINILLDLKKQQNLTILFISHDLSMVNYVCENVIIMHRGRILEKGNVNKIFKNPIHPYTQSLLKASPKLSKIHVDLAALDEKLVYDLNWNEYNKPVFNLINNQLDHQVFGTKEQVLEWIELAKDWHE